ncbi:small ribosomal subunit Rsm22 family protein [uncultured Desulfovibrio sp.]|uniref:small ribosomal subunit Rsm22 family protein n=1 Tax=uncultured Desulfovibrio sp. TaxID=167968 RepID=UPI002628B831|nr:small ribosomal subunit Rsm22 family protein [uncultured Desulfovibrio sp.]
MSAKDDSFNDSDRRSRRSGEGTSQPRRQSPRRPDDRPVRRDGADGRFAGRDDRNSGRQDDRRDNRRDGRASDRRDDRPGSRPNSRPGSRPSRGQDARRDGRREDHRDNRRDDRRPTDRPADRRDDRRQDGRSPNAPRDRYGRPAFRPEKREGDRDFAPGQRNFERQNQRPAARSFESGAWPAARALFPPLSAETQRILDMLPEALAKVWPLNTAHKRSLPDDVAQLSRLLTTERAGLARPYWSSPASISAYLYYFLPWNLVRLTRLLASLPLADPRAVAPQGGEALLVDVGSGPLTLPLALWLARPEWRSAPVRVLAMDTSSQPLELGKTLMEVLGELTGQPVWPVRVARAPLDQVVRQAAPLLSGGRARPWLISAANVLNELRFGKKRSRGASAIEDEDEFDSLDAEGMDIDGNPAADEADGEKPEGCREDRLDSFLESLSPLFDHADSRGEATAGSPAPVGPSLLFVEPGTRLGGSTIMRLRQLAVDGGLTALAPCTHQADCPLLRGQGGRTWCHFTFGSEGAPLWLEDLSQASGLGKSGLSLSPLLLAAMPEAEAQTSGSLPVRVLSAPFLVPGLAGRARYACSGKGILLLENAECLASGDELTVSIAAGAPRDRKSGALQVSPPAQQGGTPRPERRPGADEQGRRPVPYNRDNREGGRDGTRDGTREGNRPAGKGYPDRPSRAPQGDRSQGDDRRGQGGCPPRPQGNDRPQRDERSGRDDRRGRNDRPDWKGRQDRQGQPDRSNRSDRSEGSDRPDRPNRQDRQDRQDRNNRHDRPGGQDRKGRGGSSDKRSGDKRSGKPTGPRRNKR